MIKINDLQIDTGDYITSEILHDQANSQDLNIMRLTRKPGAKLISSEFDGKEIVLGGTLRGTDKADLEERIDSFKQAVTVTDGQLIVDYAGGYRLYKVNTKSVTIPRDHYHITYAPFSVVMLACDPPFGLECDVNGVPVTTTPLDKGDITSDSDSETLDLDGSANPTPKITITVNNKGDITSFDLINNTQQLSLAPTLADGDVLVVDTDQTKVTHNGEDIVFSGVMPSFLAGENNLELSIYSSTGTTLDQSQTINNATKPIYGTRKIAQSFQAGATGIIPKISLLIGKIGTLANDLTVRIETDNSGSPSGTLVTGGSLTISKSEVDGAGWINKAFSAPPACTSGTTYWIVAYTSGGDSSNAYLWCLDSASSYTSGAGKLYTSSWSSITGDMCFKIYKNVLDQNNSYEAQETVTEDFSSTTNKDAANTTANWDSSTGQLLNTLGSETLDQSVTDTTVDLSLGAGDTTVYRSFVPSQSGLCTKIQLYGKRTGTPDDNLTVTLHSDSSNSPGTQLASITVSKSSGWSSSNSWRDITWSTPIAITAGTKYWIKIYSNNYSHSAYFSVGAASYSTPSSTFAYKQYYEAYSDGVGQSGALDAVDSDIVAATLSATDTKPAGCSIAYQLSSDGTNFEDATEDTELYLSNIGSGLKFKVTLSGMANATPSVQSLSLSYKTGAKLDATTKVIAQSFAPGQTGNLGRLEMMIKKIGTPGNITVEIRSDNSGSPSATVLASQTISASDVLSSALGWVACNFSSPVSLTASTTYWIVIYAAGVSTPNAYWVRTRPGNLYAAGALKYSTDSGSNYSEYTDEDILFKTYPSSGNAHNVDLKVEYTKRYL